MALFPSGAPPWSRRVLIRGFWSRRITFQTVNTSEGQGVKKAYPLNYLTMYFYWKGYDQYHLGSAEKVMNTNKQTARKSRTFGRLGWKAVCYPDLEATILQLPKPPSLTVLICKTGSYITSWKGTCSMKPQVGKHCYVNISTAPLFAYVLTIYIYFQWTLSTHDSFF